MFELLFHLQRVCQSFCIEDVVNIDDTSDAFDTKTYEKSKYRVSVEEDIENKTDFAQGEKNVKKYSLVVVDDPRKIFGGC